MTYFCSHLVNCMQLEAAFPYNGYTPALIAQFCNGASVPLGVLTQLTFPESGIRRGRRAPPTFRMPMPETAVDEDKSFVHWEDKIGFPWQLPVMNTVAKTIRMKRSPKEQFGLSVLTANAGHHARPRLFVHDISHMRLSIASEFARIGDGS